MSHNLNKCSPTFVQQPPVPLTSLQELPIIILSLEWTCRLRGHKFVLVAELFQYLKRIHTTNAAVRRQRNGFLALWKKPKRSGGPKSVKKWTNWLQMKHSHCVHQIRMQFPSQVQQILCLLLWPKMSQ